MKTLGIGLMISVFIVGILYAKSFDITGVWTWSMESYQMAKIETNAIRFLANGEFYNGSYHHLNKTFTRWTRTFQSPNFVETYEISKNGKSIYFYLDGAEENAPIVVEGKRRFKTVYQDPEGVIYTVYYYKQGK